MRLYERMENYWEGDVTQLVLAPIGEQDEQLPMPAISLPVPDDVAASLTDGTIYWLQLATPEEESNG